MPREFTGSQEVIDVWTSDKLDYKTMTSRKTINSAFDTIMYIYSEAARLPDKMLQACAGPQY